MNAYFYKMHIILLVYKKVYFNTNDFDYCISSVCVSLLYDFKDIFPGEILSRLHSFRRIEHQIDLVLEACISNQSAYRINLNEIKELQRKVKELMTKWYIRESISPCAIPILLVLKKNRT